MPWRSGCTLLLLLGILGGCASPAARPPPTPASLTPSIDGQYSGLATGSCGGRQASADVSNGAFTLRIADDATLRGTADRNGTLQAAGAAADGRETNFTARADGTELKGGSYNGRCALAFALTRQP